jgi:hypothetical protein
MVTVKWIKFMRRRIASSTPRRTRTWSRHQILVRVLDHACARVALACQTPGADVLAACRAYQRLERYRIRVNHGWQPKPV